MIIRKCSQGHRVRIHRNTTPGITRTKKYKNGDEETITYPSSHNYFIDVDGSVVKKTNSLKVADQEFENYGLKGFSLENAQNKIKQELESNKYTDADLASILLDELGAQEDVQPLIKQIKEVFFW